MRIVSDTSKLLPPIHPNVGIEVAYRKRLNTLIDRMHKSIMYWLRLAWCANPPELAMDASAAAELIAAMRRLGSRWLSRFNKGADELGKYFAKSTFDRADGALKKILHDMGWTVKFKMTPVVQDVMTATIGAQVGLIKSIASQHLSDVQGMVMRSVQEGRKLSDLTNQLESQYQLTRKRAALIARDQNNKATATITRVRQQELGINKAIWMHSAGGKEPRPKHVGFAAGKHGGPVYDVSRGAQIGDKPGEWCWPGTLINCRCVSRAIIPGLEAA